MFFSMMVQEESVLKNQELENAVKDADYTKAIQIAFKLRRPHKLYECFAELCRLATMFLLAYFLPLSSCLLNFCQVSYTIFLQEERG